MYFRGVQFTSTIVEKAVEALSGFPGIGKRTALRLVMYLLKRPEIEVSQLAESLIKLKTELHLCEECCNVSDTEICAICSEPMRQTEVICVVEDFSDQMAVESTSQFFGKYHILGGLISPMDGIGPDDLTIQKLVERVSKNKVTEIILALSATVEGDTTMYYIAKKMQPFNVKITCIARGISVGGEIEYADEITLGRSLMNRTSYTI
jgi:recombination protein RecR